MSDSASNPFEKRQTVDLSQAVQHVECTLAGVLSSIQRLNEESQQAKEDIRATFGRQLTNLHTRETQLLRQVDVIYRARREVMQKQLAHCHQILGSLETSKKWTEEFQKHNCIVSLDCNEFEGMKKWGLLNPLNWALDEDALSKAIANFGKVDMEGVLMLPNEEPSKCLPSRVEEYYEEDQQVLNKPLNTKIHIIDIKFPKLPTKEGGSPKVSEEKSDSAYGPYRKGTYSYKACDVQTWLGCIQTETAAEPMEEASDSIPEMSNLSETASVDSKESDSIEIVSIANLCLKSGSDPSFGSSCPLGPMNENVEIENLVDNLGPCLKNDKSAWLLVSDQKETQNISVAKVCRANAVCDSFDSCVCDTNCYETAKKHRKEKDNQKWLHPSSIAGSAHSICSSNNNVLPLSDGGNSKWLFAPSAPIIPLTASSVFSSSLLTSNDTNQWLLRRSSHCSPVALSSQQVLPNHFADKDNSKWLRPASPSPAQRVNLAPVFPERFWEGDKSKWLHPESPRGSDVVSSSLKSGAYCGTGSSFVDISPGSKGHPDNNMWLAPSTITEALDEIKMKNPYLTKQMMKY